MDVLDAIRDRRSIKSFTDRPVDDAAVETLLELATLAPNHRMTEPWRFVVLGPEARRAYAETKAARRAGRIADEDAAAEIRRKTVAQIENVPVIIAFLQSLSDDPEIREEDFASIYMAVQNVLLGAVAMNLGTHVKTGAILEAPATRKILGADADERVVALVQIGEPAEVPPARPRAPAKEWMRRLP